MQDQGDNGKTQQNVNQRAGYVKKTPAQYPGNQQNDEQDCEDTHNSLPLAYTMGRCGMRVVAPEVQLRSPETFQLARRQARSTSSHAICTS
jgi:hypothetical protein